MMLDDVSRNHYVGLPVAGFTKLFSSIIFSTVWREELHVKVVWITMLAMANRHGEVIASIPGLADAARVTIPQCEDALAKFFAPDTYSRTKDNEGRRIEAIDGGWRLLNYDKHRAIRDADERRVQTRDAVRRHRARKNQVSHSGNDVSQGKPRKPGKAQAEAEAEAEAETTKSKALVALTRDAIVPQLEALFQAQHVNSGLRDAKAKLVFAYWAAKWNHGSAVYDAKRQSRLAARLRENGDDVSELLWVVDGAKRDPWSDRPQYAGIEQLFRDRETVERLAQFAPGFQRGEYHPMAAKFCPRQDGDHAVG